MTPLFTKRELAEYLRVSPQTIDRYCRDGLLRYRRTRGGKRFTYDDVLVYLDRGQSSHRDSRANVN